MHSCANVNKCTIRRYIVFIGTTLLTKVDSGNKVVIG